MSMNIFRIKPYYVDKLHTQFQGAVVFQEGGKNLLLSDSGYTVLMNDDLLAQVMEQNIDDSLGMILIQHRFMKIIDHEGSENVMLPTVCAMDVHPVFFMIDLTNRCNMACKYCLRDGNDTVTAKITSKEMVSEICNYIIAYCKNVGEDKITIQPWGGEPLLEKDKIFQIQDIMRENGIEPCISIETNGLLLSEETIAELYNRNIWVSVSIDGPQLIHDSQRVFKNGNPTHSIVEKNLCRLRDVYGGRVSIIATVTKNTCKHIDEIIRYLAVDLKLQNFKINFVHKSSFVDNDELCMSSEEIGECTLKIFNTLLKLCEQGYPVGDYNIYTKFMNILYNRKSDICICEGCRGGRKMLTFDHKGDIYPCDVTDYPEECLGNIHDGVELIDLVKNAIPVKPYFREKMEDKCNICPWYCYCKGGCTVHVKTQNKNPPQVDDIECAVNSALYPALIEKILSDPDTVNKFLQMRAL